MEFKTRLNLLTLPAAPCLANLFRVWRLNQHSFTCLVSPTNRKEREKITMKNEFHVPLSNECWREPVEATEGK